MTLKSANGGTLSGFRSNNLQQDRDALASDFFAKGPQKLHSRDRDNKHGEHRVLVVDACTGPGPALASGLAVRGARVVALGTDASGLRNLAGTCPGRIEPLAMTRLDKNSFARLGTAWGGAPLQVVINLMPLAVPRDVNGACAQLARLFKATARGLIAGQGALINVVSIPADPLDLPATAMAGAFTTVHDALNATFKPRGLRAHLVILTANTPTAAPEALRFLASPSARGMAPQTLRLG